MELYPSEERVIEVSGLKANEVEGIASLEENKEMIYGVFQSMTYRVYKRAFKEGNRKGWEKSGFVCLDPHARYFGGLGNLLLGFLGVQFFASTLNRPFTINNGLITDMFHHPDTRQNFAPLGNAQLKRVVIKGVEAKRLSADPSKFNSIKFIGTHGAPAMVHAFKSLSPLVPTWYHGAMNKLEVGKEQLYNNLMCQGYASWIMSRPSKRMMDALAIYKKNFINQCDSQNIPDIAIQIRTLDDIEDEFDSSHEACYVSCAVKKARAMYQELQREICIFVTSNRYSTIDNVVQSLRSILNTNKLHPYKILSHQARSKNKNETMHSKKLVEIGRHVSTIARSIDFSRMQDIMDWFLLGEAAHVIGTALESTYLLTARLRIGSSKRHIFNPLQHDISPAWNKNTGFKCHCETHVKLCS